ncbi:peptide ABC transporter substrate-binding protein [Faecalimonas sp.]
MKMKKLVALCLAGAMAISVVACGSGNKGGDSKTAGAYPGTKDKDMVTVDLRTEPAELNSIKTSDVPSGDILRMVISGLYKLDKDDKPVPELAEDTKVSEDGKTYTMKLKKGVKWSNGEPVTAHDFVFAYQTISKKETGSVYGFIVYQNLLNGQEVFDGKKAPSELGVKALDDYTLEVTFVNPIPYALHLFSFSSFYPLNQKAYEEIGADKYAKDADKIVTNGAYKVEEWVHDDHITLAKNEEYYNAKEVNIPKVKYLMLKDANARMNAFKAGQIDVINVGGEQLEQAKKEGMKLTSYVDNSNWYFQFNTKKKELSNAKIRQALGMAIDTESLCKNVIKTGATPATGVVPSSIAGADGKKYAEVLGDITEYNTKKAKQLFEEGLKEIGMTADKYKISFLTEDSAGAQKEAAFYQEQWKKALGIQVEITPMPFKAKLAAMDSGEFDIVFAGWSPDYNDPMTYLDMFATGNGNNYGKYSNPEYDKLIADATKEVDKVKRQGMLMEAEKLVCQKDAAIYPLYFQSVTYTVSDKLEGMTRTGFQEFDFTDGAKIK